MPLSNFQAYRCVSFSSSCRGNTFLFPYRPYFARTGKDGMHNNTTTRLLSALLCHFTIIVLLQSPFPSRQFAYKFTCIIINPYRNIPFYRTNFQTKVSSLIDPFNVYFSSQVADHVIMMDCYSARDVTNQALVSNLRVLLSVMALP